MTTEFQEKVYSLCRRIPEGKVSTYGEIARALGRRGIMARAVGNALNKNPYAPAVPCHRVVKSDGSLGGFATGSKKKIKLLAQEGIRIKNNIILDFGEKKFVFFR